MKQKIIGCTPRIIVENGESKQFINDLYVTALKNINCIPILLPLDIDDLEIVLSKCDGFLITGGIDINPACYKQKNKGSKDYDKRLDEIDKKVTLYAVKHSKPLLGICRGHQAINVFLGGDLTQDIGKAHQDGAMHNVYTVPNKIIALDPVIEVNSYHHQVVGNLVPDLVCIGKSDEGYIEGFIHEDLPIISVQWHPEKMLDKKAGQIVFDSYRRLLDKDINLPN